MGVEGDILVVDWTHFPSALIQRLAQGHVAAALEHAGGGVHLCAYNTSTERDCALRDALLADAPARQRK